MALSKASELKPLAKRQSLTTICSKIDSMKMSSNSPISRRRFLAAAGATAALPTLIPLGALGAVESSAPSNRITLGVIGCGGMGNSNTDSFLRNANCQILAACDVDEHHLAEMVKKVNGHYK